MSSPSPLDTIRPPVSCLTDRWSDNVADMNDIQIPDQSGTFAVITGSNSGIGLGAAHRLAAAGAEIVLAVRNESKGAAALAEIKSATPNATVSVERLDLSSLDSIAAFADRMLDA